LGSAFFISPLLAAKTRRYEEDMTIEILKSTARLDDEDGKERFLATIGSGVEGLRAQLKPGAMIHLEQYEKETQTARYLKTDGVSYICFIVIGVSLDDARLIAIASRDRWGWSTADFRKAVGKALGVVMPPATLD
jgi:hypothetical protein